MLLKRVSRWSKDTGFEILFILILTLLILVINQLDAQNFCFTVSLFRASTCLEHNVLIIRRSKLYYTASGIVTLCRWPSRAQVHLFSGQPPIECDDTRICIIQF